MPRRAARALLVDPQGRVLLLRGHDPARPSAGWWFTPGGGLDPGEDVEAALRREVREETGLDLTGTDLGPVVLRRTVDFGFEGVAYRQDEDFFAVRVPAFEVDTSAWTDVERRSVDEVRWWTLDGLAGTPDTVYPQGLAALLTALLPVLAQAGTEERSTTRSGWV